MQRSSNIKHKFKLALSPKLNNLLLSKLSNLTLIQSNNQPLLRPLPTHTHQTLPRPIPQTLTPLSLLDQSLLSLNLINHLLIDLRMLLLNLPPRSFHSIFFPDRPILLLLPSHSSRVVQSIPALLLHDPLRDQNPSTRLTRTTTVFFSTPRRGFTQKSMKRTAGSRRRRKRVRLLESRKRMCLMRASS